DITTHKQYQEALAEIRTRDAKIKELLEMSEESDRRADEAGARAKAAEKAREKAEQEVVLASEREEKARAAAHRYHEQYEDAIDQRNRLLDEQGAYISRTAEAEERAKAAEKARDEACRELDGARQAFQAAKLRGDKL